MMKNLSQLNFCGMGRMASLTLIFLMYPIYYTMAEDFGVGAESNYLTPANSATDTSASDVGNVPIFRLQLQAGIDELTKLLQKEESVEEDMTILLENLEGEAGGEETTIEAANDYAQDTMNDKNEEIVEPSNEMAQATMNNENGEIAEPAEEMAQATINDENEEEETDVDVATLEEEVEEGHTAGKMNGEGKEIVISSKEETDNDYPEDEEEEMVEASEEKVVDGVEKEASASLLDHLLEAIDSLDDEDYFVATIKGINGNDITGEVVVFAPSSGDIIEYAGEIENLELNLEASNCPAVNGCGIYIHSGFACDSSVEQGGHFYENVPVDPWTVAKYSSTSEGTAFFSGKIEIGSQDVANRAFVIHNSAGQHIGCGTLERINTSVEIDTISDEEIALDDDFAETKEEKMFLDDDFTETKKETVESSKEVLILTEPTKEKTTEAPIMKIEVLQSSTEEMQMILVGMNEEMDDNAIFSWKNCTTEYIKYYFTKQENIITSLNVTLLLQEQKFESGSRRNLRSLQTDTGKVIISYKQDNFYTTDGDTEVNAEIFAKEPFGTSDLRTEYMNRLRATLAPVFLSLSGIEKVVIVEEDFVEEFFEEEKEDMEGVEGISEEEEEKQDTKEVEEIGEVEEISEEEEEKQDTKEVKEIGEVEEIPEKEKEGSLEEDKEDMIGAEEISEEKVEMEGVEEVSEEDTEDVEEAKEVAEEEEEVAEEEDSGLTTLVIVFIVVLLVLAFVVFCKAKKEDLTAVDLDKLDMSVTSIRQNLDRSERSSAFEAPENSQRKYVEVYAPAGPLGITVDDSEGAPIIYSISRMSSIANRVFVGDRLISVDGEDVKKLSSLEVSQLISQKSANPKRKLGIIRFLVDGEVPKTGDHDTTDSSVSSFRRSSVDSSTAFDAPENTTRKYVEIYAPPGQLGITVDDSKGAPIIYAVSEMSSIVDKVFEGDRLVAVDDEDVKKLDSMEVSQLIGRKCANPKRKLSIVRYVPEE